ncbi:MAG: hypothetical protein HKUEN07_37390 [Rhodocyclaceae bacterium]|nr:MAG: hypothetical protein HKUEN07_37390 [Rhodocyclaceae bacterium]
MKIRRFVASDIREAMRQVREALGPDAVILETQRVEGGIELSAAVDYEPPATPAAADPAAKYAAVAADGGTGQPAPVAAPVAAGSVPRLADDREFRNLR